MTLTAARFDEFFGTVYKDKEGKPLEPFPWQSRLARELAANQWPDCIDLPTASGKTSVIDIAVFTLACQATLPPKERPVGRRIFFTVNRRVIVDEAHQRSVDLAIALKNAKDGILKEVADALRTIGGETELPLDVVQLRGGIYRDSSWARSIVQPTVVCTTADQLGSRLLFRGYGVSAGMQPIHAALAACDSVVLLDEAHVTKAFAQTLRLIERYQQHQPGMRFVEMTATPSERTGRRFELASEDKVHPLLKQRQEAAKPAELIKVPQKSLVAELTKRAIGAVNEERKAIGIIVNRLQTARDVHAKLAEQFGTDVQLVIGRMRPLDRDELQEQLRTIVGPDRPKLLEKPVFIVATQCLEVGADYDFDALITECASTDALRQRFGRLNRKGRDIVASAAIITTDAALKDEDPIYGHSLRETWTWLTNGDRTSIDFGIAAFKQLWDEVDDELSDRLTNATCDAAVLLPAHLDALCQTNPQPVPSPDVSYFIYGPQRDNLEVIVCWRADLGNDQSLWAEIVSALPPTSPECMSVSLRALRQWMMSAEAPIDADVALRSEEDARDSKPSARTVLLWRGAKDAKPVSDIRQIRPGDTLVIPAPDETSLVLGHLPQHKDGVVYDLAETALAKARRQRIVRVHPAIKHDSDLVNVFEDYLSEAKMFSKAAIRERLGTLASDFNAGPTEIEYPHPAGQPSPGVIFRFNTLLSAQDDWKQSSSVVDDGEDESTDSILPLSLKQHVEDVVRFTNQNVKLLGLNDFTELFQLAADHHDDGKRDLRFKAMLAGISPYEAVERPALAKSGERGQSRREREERRLRAMLPDRFRHEMLSMQIVTQFYDRLVKDASIDSNLLLHLIAAHHGHARPFAPVVCENGIDGQLLELAIDELAVTAQMRQKTWVPAHRLDSGVAERFWSLTRKHGWWGLAYLESILRLADQQASALEEEKPSKQNGAMR